MELVSCETTTPQRLCKLELLASACAAWAFGPLRSALVSALLSCTCLNRTILRTLMLAFPHLSQHITSSISGATARRQSWSHHQSICLCARRLSQWRVPFTGNGTWVRGGCPARRSCRNRSLSFKLESSLQGPGARFQPTPKIPTAGRKMPLQAGKPRPPIARAARNQELKQYFSQVLPYLRFGCFLCQLPCRMPGVYLRRRGKREVARVNASPVKEPP